jgi:hypothetical protein
MVRVPAYFSTAQLNTAWVARRCLAKLCAVVSLLAGMGKLDRIMGARRRYTELRISWVGNAWFCTPNVLYNNTNSGIVHRIGTLILGLWLYRCNLSAYFGFLD